MKAKTVSLIVKICTCIFIVVCCVLKWMGVFPTATISEICIAGGTLAGIFGDVSINLMMEKFKKNGDKNIDDNNCDSGGVVVGSLVGTEIDKEESCEGC